MKKDKTEKILNSLNDYLKKRNYEVSGNVGEASEKEVGMLGLLGSQSANSYSFSATSANPHHVEHQFARLKSWMVEASEPCRSELSQLLFPLFVHIYLELGASAGKGASNAFFQRNFTVFRVNRDYELTLRQLVNTTGEGNYALIRSLRSGKYQVRLSDSSTLHYLLRYLKNGNNPTIVQILNRYIEIELDDGLVPSSIISDLEKTTCPASPSDEDSPPPDCTLEELAALSSVISSVRALPHPGLSLALYSVINAYNGVCNAAISAGVDMLACGFEDSVIKVWSLTPHWPHPAPSSGPSSVRTSALLCCDQARFDDPLKEQQGPVDGDEASGAGAGGGRGRKQASGGEVWSLRGHSGPVYDLAFTDTSPHLLSVSEDTYMRLWNVADGECVAKYSGHNYPVFRVAMSPHSVHAATGSFDLTARLWSLDYLHPVRVFAGHTASVSALAFHSNCSYLATGSWDHSVRLWQVTDANAVRILLHHTAPVTSLAFAPHGKYLASGSDDGSVVVWDLASGKVLADLTHLTTSDLPAVWNGSTPASESCVQLSWSSDSRLLVAASLDGMVRTIGLTPAAEQPSSANAESGPAATAGQQSDLESCEVHSVACGSDATLLHASLTSHNYIAAVVAQQPDR